MFTSLDNDDLLQVAGSFTHFPLLHLPSWSGETYWRPSPLKSPNCWQASKNIIILEMLSFISLQVHFNVCFTSAFWQFWLFILSNCWKWEVDPMMKYQTMTLQFWMNSGVKLWGHTTNLIIFAEHLRPVACSCVQCLENTCILLSWKVTILCQNKFFFHVLKKTALLCSFYCFHCFHTCGRHLLTCWAQEPHGSKQWKELDRPPILSEFSIEVWPASFTLIGSQYLLNITEGHGRDILDTWPKLPVITVFCLLFVCLTYWFDTTWLESLEAYMWNNRSTSIITCFVESGISLSMSFPSWISNFLFGQGQKANDWMFVWHSEVFQQTVLHPANQGQSLIV